MARPRIELQALLKTLCANVYFQPPDGTKMTYPCITYERDTGVTLFADNLPHRIETRYMVTIIDRDPDSAIRDKVAFLPSCTFNRSFPADNLNHDVYTLYF